MSNPTEFWNSRYQEEVYVYGKEPNVFFAQALLQLKPGKLLCVAEGEGRNAVFAAQHNWDTYAFDLSEAGKNKALNLAQEKNTHMDYRIGDATEPLFPGHEWDAVSLVFSHFPESVKQIALPLFFAQLKSGGTVILQCFSTNHPPYREKSAVGGPADLDLLYNAETLPSLFPEGEFLLFEEVESYLNEGPYHQGIGKVINLIFQKK